MKATWNGQILAQSDQTIMIENNHYFPPDSVNRHYLRESARRSTCPWKGEAHYYDVVVGEKESTDAAWSYPSPKEAAREITDYIAFWKGVTVEA